jgi:hypothetical protein
LKENKNENTRLGTKGRKNVGVKVWWSHKWTTWHFKSFSYWMSLTPVFYFLIGFLQHLLDSIKFLFMPKSSSLPPTLIPSHLLLTNK